MIYFLSCYVSRPVLVVESRLTKQSLRLLSKECLRAIRDTHFHRTSISLSGPIRRTLAHAEGLWAVKVELIIVGGPDG